MSLEDLPIIHPETITRLAHNFDEKRTESINEINSYLAENNPELHSLILGYAQKCKIPGESITLAYMLLYIISDGLDEKSLDALWKEL